MDRVLEPELMDTDEQAAAYAAADFAVAHDAVVGAFGERFPEVRGGRALDLGCGPADVTVRFARAIPGLEILAVDGSAAMLAEAEARLARESLTDRVTLAKHLLPDPSLPVGFDVVLANSVLHHLHEPSVLWSTVRRCARPGAAVFVSDLRRPTSAAAARALVQRYSGDEPQILRDDFFNSLCAAFTVSEVRAQVRDLPLTVEAIGDRHLVAFGTRPAVGS